MQIVIDIEDSTYEAIKHEYCILPPQKGLLKVLWDAIHNGTPLPKGHGQLVDRDKFEYLKTIHDAIYGQISWSDAIIKIKYSAPTIIEADREE